MSQSLQDDQIEESSVLVESAQSEIDQLEKESIALRQRITKLRRAQPQIQVNDYQFLNWTGGTESLSQLFGEHSELILVHNMGKRCSYCTLWADSFIGLTKHLESRAAFVVTSPDLPDTQQQFAASRGWNFRMYSTAGSTFRHDMGFEPTPGEYWPGASVFRKDETGIYRMPTAIFGPGDPYCSLWHFFDLLPTEVEWRPM